MGIWGIIIVFTLIGWGVQYKLKSKFKKYGKVALQNNLTGQQIAELMLQEHGISDVSVISTPGKLTDHYNPKNKTINLSEAVFEECSVSAAAIAAHECGHAVQHAKAYSWLQMRSTLVPIVNVSSRMMQFIFIAGMIGASFLHFFDFQMVLMTVIAAQAMITIFTLITLPVEYDASNRALAWMRNSPNFADEEIEQSKDALKWAANTYLVAALAAVSQLAFYIALSSRD
ncbi:MAG: Zn-dependent membrane protease YugP [Flavobacteriales bacterium]|jgi:Zn-dependent membrane protease YugP